MTTLATSPTERTGAPPACVRTSPSSTPRPNPLTPRNDKPAGREPTAGTNTPEGRTPALTIWRTVSADTRSPRLGCARNAPAPAFGERFDFDWESGVAEGVAETLGAAGGGASGVTSSGVSGADGCAQRDQATKASPIPCPAASAKRAEPQATSPTETAISADPSRRC
jgi:hypothetical protein